MTTASLDYTRIVWFSVFMMLLDVAAFTQPHPKIIRFRGEAVGERISIGGFRSGTPLGFVVQTFEISESGTGGVTRLYSSSELSESFHSPMFRSDDVPRTEFSTMLDYVRLRSNSYGVWSVSSAGLFQHRGNENIHIPCADSALRSSEIVPLPGDKALAHIVMGKDPTNPDSLTYAYIMQAESSNPTCSDVIRPVPYELGFLSTMCQGRDGTPILAVRPKPQLRGDGSGLLITSELRRLPIEGLERRQDYNVVLITPTEGGYRLILERSVSGVHDLIVECNENMVVKSIVPIKPMRQRLIDYKDDGEYVVVVGDSTINVYDAGRGIFHSMSTQDARSYSGLTWRDNILSASYFKGKLYTAFDTVIAVFQIETPSSVHDRTAVVSSTYEGLLDVTNISSPNCQFAEIFDILGRHYITSVRSLADQRFIDTTELPRGFLLVVGNVGSVKLLCTEQGP